MKTKSKVETEMLLKLLKLEEKSGDHDSILSNYHRRKARLEKSIQKVDNIIDRIKLQNRMIELEDYFLNYQRARIEKDFDLKDFRES